VTAFIAGVLAYRFECDRRESAFQTRFQQLKHDADEALKIGTAKEDVSRFFSQKGLTLRSEQSKAFGYITTRRGCARGWGCSIGSDSGLISISVTFDEQGRINSKPIVTAKYAGDCL
jgi:hypothetical protein